MIGISLHGETHVHKCGYGAYCANDQSPRDICRVFRIESRDSYASVPLDRTVHLVGNVVVGEANGETVAATANCIVHTYGKKGGMTRGSLYDYVLRRVGGALKIAKKKIVFIDDRLEGPIDVYHL